MRAIITSSRYRRDYRKSHRRGLDLERIQTVVDEIAEHGTAPERCRPHCLAGNWSDFWECHIAPDWLLIYTVNDEEVVLYRTGTHADLFG